MTRAVSDQIVSIRKGSHEWIALVIIVVFVASHTGLINPDLALYSHRKTWSEDV